MNYVLQDARFEAVSRIKEIGVEPILPRRSDKGSAGYDFFWFMNEEITIMSGKQGLVFSGIKARMPNGVLLELNSRSGHGAKLRISLGNSVGWVDSSYYNNKENEGEIIFIIRNDGENPFTIKKGMKYAQGKFSPYFVTADDHETVGKRPRKSGLGSSDEELDGK